MYESLTRVVAIANQKGGVGKTTTAVNLAACLADAGCEVLLIDLDPQGNATSGLGLDRDALDGSTYDVLIGRRTVDECVVATSRKGLDVLGCTPDLAGAEVELVPAPDREFRLRDALSATRLRYDVVLLDCPPSLGLLTVNALGAATCALIPVQTEFYALEGMGHLLRTIDLVHQHLNRDLIVDGIVLTMFDSRTKLANQVSAEVAEHFGELLYDTVVPRNVRLSEAPSHGQPIVDYEPRAAGAGAYRSLAQEFARRNDVIVSTSVEVTTEGRMQA